MSHTVYASFPEASDAEKAIGALLDYGARQEDIGLLAYGEDALNADGHAKTGLTTTTAGDAAAGAAKGVGVGLGFGALAALASIFVPGVGLVVGGGALAAALSGVAGATAAGVITGGVIGYLEDQGVPRDIAEHYHGTVAGGGALVTVVVPSGDLDEITATDVFRKYDAHDINSYSPYHAAAI